MRDDRGTRLRLGRCQGPEQSGQARRAVRLCRPGLSGSLRVEFEVSKPEDGEVRHKVVGEIERRLFTVVYAPRGGVTRIISGRRSNSSEARRYGRLHS